MQALPGITPSAAASLARQGCPAVPQLQQAVHTRRGQAAAMLKQALEDAQAAELALQVTCCMLHALSAQYFSACINITSWQTIPLQLPPACVPRMHNRGRIDEQDCGARHKQHMLGVALSSLGGRFLAICLFQ